MEVKNGSTVDLDLDALVQESKRVRIGGQIIEIQPPDLEELMRVAKLGGLMQDAQRGTFISARKMTDAEKKANPDYHENGGYTKKIGGEEAVDAFAKLRSAFTKFIPDLKDIKLNIEQLFALINLVMTMAAPESLKELEKEGIKLNVEQKKILSASKKKLQNS